MDYNFDDFCIGQGLVSMYYDKYCARHYYHSLIVSRNDEGVFTVPVKALINPSEMFDASDDKHFMHNVPLRDSPPPFSEIGSQDIYAIANLSTVEFVSFSDFEKFHVMSSDNHICISDNDLHTVFNHDKEQDEKEFKRELPRKNHDMEIQRDVPYIDYSGYSKDDFGISLS
jgi:hypothetical protein